MDSITPSLTGIGRYTWELAKGLIDSPSIRDLKFLAGSRWIRDPTALLARPSAGRNLKNPRWLRGIQNSLVMRDRLFHGPNFFLPKFVHTGVITVMDLSVLRFPELHPGDRVAQFERDLATSMAKAEHIIVPSETVREEVITHFGLAPDIVSTVYLGISDLFIPMNHARLEEALSPFGLRPGGYGLSVSTLEPRKNIRQLLAAWRDLEPALRKHYPLAIAGAAGWKNDEIRSDIQRGSAEGWVKPLGYVPEADLPTLYAGAGLFAYLSTYEGFGFPPVEAMASGTPTIVSDQSCLPEVTAGAALTIDANDVEAVREAIRRGLTDEHWRREARTRGLAVAGSYRWSICVEQTIEIYKNVRAKLGGSE